MNKKLLSIIFTVFLLTPFSFALSAEKTAERIHYKCYLQLSNQSTVVSRFVSVDQSQSEFLNGLPGRLVYAADGVTGVAIETIYECVNSKQRFKSKQARDLEANTPF